jgi:hypothetical protein
MGCRHRTGEDEDARTDRAADAESGKAEESELPMQSLTARGLRFRAKLFNRLA